MAVFELDKWPPWSKSASIQKPVWQHLLEMLTISTLFGLVSYGGAYLVRQAEREANEASRIGPFLLGYSCTKHSIPARHVDLTVSLAEGSKINGPYTIIAADPNRRVGDIKYVNGLNDLPVSIHFTGFLRGGQYDAVVLSGRVFQSDASRVLTQTERIVGTQKIDQSCLTQ